MSGSTPGAGPDGAFRRFLWIWSGAVAFLAAAALPLAGLLLLPWPRDANVRWVGSLWGRKRVLAEQLRAPHRLLIVGGSSGLFSVDGELLEARLGLPAVNLATHAGLGLRHLLADARESARAGDVLVLYLEDGHYWWSGDLTELEEKTLWTNCPSRLVQLPWAQLTQELYRHPLADYRQGWQRRNDAMRFFPPEEIVGGYAAIELSLQGDYRGRVAVGEGIQAASLTGAREVTPAAAAELDEFLRWTRRRSIEVIAVRAAGMRMAASPRSEQDRWNSMLREFYLRRGVPFLHVRELDELPRELLLDTVKHASTAGRQIITEALAAPLAALLQRPAPPVEDVCLLVASPDAILGRQLVLASSRPASCRYLAKDDLHSPLCLTPEEVRRARRAGQRFVFVGSGDPPLAGAGSLAGPDRCREAVNPG